MEICCLPLRESEEAIPPTTQERPLARAKHTIEYALRPYRIPLDTLREEHGAVLEVITKMVGVTPRHTQYLMLWPPGYETMNVVVPNLFDFPYCDSGIGSIDGGLRSLSAYVASRAYGCSYCSAHCATLGTIWKGDSIFLSKNAAAMSECPSEDETHGEILKIPLHDRYTWQPLWPASPARIIRHVEIFSAQALAVIKISKKLGIVPCNVDGEDLRQMRDVFDAREEEAVVNATAAMGFLNKFMDTVGMTLELEQIAVGAASLAETGWTPGTAYDEEADAELMLDDVREAASTSGCNMCPGVLSVAQMLLGAKLETMKALQQIPRSDKDVRKACQETAGFVPYFLHKMEHSNANEAFAWAFLLRLNEGTEEVPPYLKQMMCYLCATNAGNIVLRAHYAFMAHRSGVAIQRLVDIGRREVVADGVSAREVAAIALAEACSMTPSNMTPTLVDLLSRHYSPAGLVELVVTVSVAHMFHRWTSYYVPETYEREILRFVKRHGSSLGINPTSPSKDDQMLWESITPRRTKKHRTVADTGRKQ